MPTFRTFFTAAAHPSLATVLCLYSVGRYQGSSLTALTHGPLTAISAIVEAMSGATGGHVLKVGTILPLS